jgi:quercetin dioxygenase-like cupin family protein
MKNALFILIGLFLAASAVAAEPGQVTPLMKKDLKEIAGKEVVLITVDYPPGASDLAHRHNAHVFVYVVEGSIVMQVKDGKQVTLGPGQTFYESPDDIHAVGRNASETKPAKFIVFFVKDKETPLLSPAQ